MARIRLFAVLAIALSAGGALAYGTYNYLKNVPVKTVTMPTQPVVVAATDLQLGEAVGDGDLNVVQWPAESVPEGAFAQESEVVGRGLLMPVVKNEPLLDAKLAPRESGAGLPPVIPKGMRAVSVRVNEVIGVAGYVLPGTHVDVLATGMPTENRADTTSKLVLANVQVLTAGTKLEQKEDKSEPMQVTVVTLLVTPEQAERLALASTEGKIQLALRNPLDLEKPETPGIQPGKLLGLTGAPRAARAAAPSAPRTARATVSAPVPMAVPEPVVEIIRGDKRANEVVR
jgi:pilus assembly protein CpaB